MKLYDHQQKILDEDPNKVGLFLGTGSGKTRTALMLARGRTLVICPKTQYEDRNWEREFDQISPKGYRVKKLTVISKEAFRRDAQLLPRFDTVIVDEAHTCLGATPDIRWRKREAVPKCSQLFEELCAYLERTSPERVYLCTATIMRSPMTVWAAAVALGRKWDFYSFRSTFYFRLPMPGREVWRPRDDSMTKDRLAAAVKKLGFVGRLEDFFDVPDQTYRTVMIDLTAKQKALVKRMRDLYPDPFVRVGKIHQIENGILAGDEFSSVETFENGKLDALLDFSVEFPQMVVFAKYRAQIDEIENAMRGQGKEVFKLTGDTKERGKLIEAANKAKEYVFIAQAQVSAGWELPECPVMVCASRTHSFVDYVQAHGRIQRANNIKKNLYIDLVAKGGPDEALDKCLKNKQDYDERIYSQTL